MIQSLVRTMKILEALSTGNKKYSVAEIAEYTALPPSTVHRILQTLLSQNYVSKDELTHLYYLGYALIPLGAKAAQQINITDAATPVLKKLSDETKEDTYLIIKSGRKGLVLQTVEGPHPLKIVDRYGSEVELHCGAIRKALLAFQSPEFIEEYLNYGLKKYTEHTLVDQHELKESLNEIRAEGVGASIGEYIKDGLGVGAPILNSKGEAVASIGIIVPIARATEDNIKAFKQIVKQKAKELEARLGF